MRPVAAPGSRHQRRGTGGPAATIFTDAPAFCCRHTRAGLAAPQGGWGRPGAAVTSKRQRHRRPFQALARPAVSEQLRRLAVQGGLDQARRLPPAFAWTAQAGPDGVRRPPMSALGRRDEDRLSPSKIERSRLRGAFSSFAFPQSPLTRLPLPWWRTSTTQSTDAAPEAQTSTGWPSPSRLASQHRSWPWCRPNRRNPQAALDSAPSAASNSAAVAYRSAGLARPCGRPSRATCRHAARRPGRPACRRGHSPGAKGTRPPRRCCAAGRR